MTHDDERKKNDDDNKPNGCLSVWDDDRRITLEIINNNIAAYIYILTLYIICIMYHRDLHVPYQCDVSPSRFVYTQ